MARFLIITMPVSGHVSPLLPLTQELVARGHTVRWYGSRRFQARIEQTGAVFLPFQAAPDLEQEKLNERFPERAKLSGIAQAKWDMKYIIDLNFDQYDDLCAIVADDRPDIMVGDFLTWGAQSLAQSQNIPYAVVNVLKSRLSESRYRPGWSGHGPQQHAIRSSAQPIAELVPAACDIVGHSYPLQPAARQQRPAAHSRDDLEFPFRVRLFLQPTIPAFEYPRSDLPGHIHFIGALIPKSSTQFTQPDWWQELDDGRPVVLVTQGTVATNLDDLLNPALEALAGEDVLVVGTTAGQPLEQVKAHPLPANVHLEPFVPFDRLMPHVDVMVTNGGYGGTHFALTHGVPLVAGGMSEDKAEICARIGWSGVGINLKTATPTPVQVRDAVKTVLSNGHYRRQAQAMRDAFAQHDAPKEAGELLEKLNSA